MYPISFSYQNYHVIRRIPNKVGKIWAILCGIEDLPNNTGFPCRSELNGQHSGSCRKGEMDWIVAKDENGNFLIAAPKDAELL